MSAPFLAGVAAGYGIAVPVGAIAVLIAGLSARTSLRVGAAAGLGAATADGLYALVAVVGGAAVAGVLAPFATPLRWAAAVVLLVLAALTVRSAWRKPSRQEPARQRRAWRKPSRQEPARQKRAWRKPGRTPPSRPEPQGAGAPTAGRAVTAL